MDDVEVTVLMSVYNANLKELGTMISTVVKV